ncbi:hypothetical protein bmyco0003_54980 [Bacillus pseudomycoides]|nr:hypothetical protein bmyco0003_54980 [Bacillus pseudomycoides]
MLFFYKHDTFVILDVFKNNGSGAKTLKYMKMVYQTWTYL